MRRRGPPLTTFDQLEREQYLEKISEDCWRVKSSGRETTERKYLDHLCEIGHHVS